MNITMVNGNNYDPKWDLHEEEIIQIKGELQKKGHTVEYFPVQKMNLAYCQGCWDCWTKTPGVCRLKDDGEQYTKALSNSDVVLYISPVSAGFITTETKKALDRFIPNALPYITIYEEECHHLQRYPDNRADIGIILFDDENLSSKSCNIIYKNFDRIQKNMRSKRVIKYRLTTTNSKELVNEIIGN
ncbi:MAG: NAD(P)H-dependent oxidoreductase [Spirochaetaceae bacterium]